MNAVKWSRNWIIENVLFSHISLLWQLLVTQLWNAPLGFIPFSTLKKCNGCLTFTCAVFKRCPRHYYQTLYRVISFHIAVSVPPEWSAGEPAIDPTPLKKKPLLRLVKSCPVRSCLTCKLHTSCLICFSFYLQSMVDGILGKACFFLWLNNTWIYMDSGLSISHAWKCTHSSWCFTAPTNKAVASPCNGKRCWLGLWKESYWLR